MIGRSLYEIYQDSIEEQNCSSDNWEDLEDIEQELWGIFANKLTDMKFKAIKQTNELRTALLIQAIKAYPQLTKHQISEEIYRLWPQLNSDG